MRVPVITELVLGGLIPDAPMKDAVLGDLAEEWRERALCSGRFRAGVWYRGQALRSSVPLLAAWARDTSWGVHLAVVGWGMVAGILTEFFRTMTVIVLLYVFDAARVPWWLAASSTLLGASAFAALAGAATARVFIKAPVPALLWQMFVTTVFVIELSGPANHGWPNHSYVLVGKMISLLAIAGTACRILSVRARGNRNVDGQGRPC